MSERVNLKRLHHARANIATFRPRMCKALCPNIATDKKKKRRPSEMEAACLAAGLLVQPRELGLLTEIVSYISSDVDVVDPGFDASDPRVQLCYKLRYEAAEARYSRMKAALCAMMELMRTRERIAAPEEEPSSDELVRLREINRCLRNGIAMNLPPWEAPPPHEAEVAALRAQLATAHSQITAMDLELARLNDKKFEEDERAREYEDMFRHMLRFKESDPGPVHPRFHPISVCQDDACKSYARRLRNGLRQAVAEAYVRDRNIRIHGHFRRVVEPIERLRADKDAEIARLRRRIRQLECAAFMTVEEAEAMTTVNRDLVDALARVDESRRLEEKLRVECAHLQARRNELQARVLELSAELQVCIFFISIGALLWLIWPSQDANRTIESVAERRVLCQAELSALATERESVQRIWDRIDCFMTGSMAREYEHKRAELERLEQEMSVMHDRMDGICVTDEATGKRARV